MPKFLKFGVTAIVIVFVAIAAVFAATSGHPDGLDPDPAVASVVRLDNVRLMTMSPGAPQVETGKSVLVSDGYITAVAPSDALETPAGAQVIDGEGQTLLPGLIDAHVHIWDEAELAAYLAHGVTSVRNMSGMPLHLEMAARIDRGKMLGPDLVTTGPILNSPGPNVQDNHQIVETADEARAAVRSQHEAGYRYLKVYSNLHRDAYEAILNEARRLEMPICGHTPEGIRYLGIPSERPFDMTFDEVLAQDWWTIEHVESIAWHGLRDRIDDEVMSELVARIAEAGVVVTPTLIAHANLVRVAATRGAYLDRPGTDTINPLLKRLEKGVYDFWSSQDPSTREGPRAAFYLRATGMLHDAGVPLIAGSDAGIFTNIPGSALTRELELLVQAGLSPYEALAAATVTAGPAIGLADRGQIAPGFRANLVLAPSDPLADISVVERPTGVMVAGRWLDSQSLARLRETARETSELRTARHMLASLVEIR